MMSNATRQKGLISLWSDLLGPIRFTSGDSKGLRTHDTVRRLLYVRELLLPCSSHYKNDAINLSQSAASIAVLLPCSFWDEF